VGFQLWLVEPATLKKGVEMDVPASRVLIPFGFDEGDSTPDGSIPGVRSPKYPERSL
jgi:hypothetical protein